MSKTKILIVISLLQTFSWPIAQAENREITVLAPSTCREWTTARSTRTKVKTSYAETMQLHSLQMWYLGLITGLNASYPTSKNLLENVDSSLLFDWMDRYCSENDTGTVYRGAKNFIDMMEERPKK